MNNPNFEQFRPISLCNCIYIISTNIVANRIRGILSKVVYSKQFSFLEKRQIHDVIGTEQKVIHSAKIKKLLYSIIKVELSKACDPVDWAYLWILLTHTGFDLPVFIWMISCVQSILFAILINGSASPFFHIREGTALRMSPRAFIIHLGVVGS